LCLCVVHKIEEKSYTLLIPRQFPFLGNSLLTLNKTGNVAICDAFLFVFTVQYDMQDK